MLPLGVVVGVGRTVGTEILKKEEQLDWQNVSTPTHEIVEHYLKRLFKKYIAVAKVPFSITFCFFFFL